MASVRSVLPAAAIPIFDTQVAAITRVQRTPPSWDPVGSRIRAASLTGVALPCFPAPTNFSRVAENSLHCPRQAVQSSLDEHCRAHFRPDHYAQSEARRILRVGGATGGQTVGQSLSRPIGAKSPRDYWPQWQNILQRYGDQFPARWLLHDENTAHRVALSDAEYLIVGEKEGVEYLPYHVEPAIEGLYYLEHYDDTPEPFRGKIESLLEGSGYRLTSRQGMRGKKHKKRAFLSKPA